MYILYICVKPTALASAAGGGACEADSLNVHAHWKSPKNSWAAHDVALLSTRTRYNAGLSSCFRKPWEAKLSFKMASRSPQHRITYAPDSKRVRKLIVALSSMLVA